MTEKPDWFLRLVLLAILLVLAAHVAVEYRTARRYLPVGGREILDTRTGVAYVQGEEGPYEGGKGKTIYYAVDLVGVVEKQKKK